METILKSVAGIIAGCCTYLFGGADVWLLALITMIIADYATGLAKAYVLGELSSRVGFKGIVKKLMYFSIVAVAVMADNITEAEQILRTAVIGFLIVNEALSILENCAKAELPVPKILIAGLHKLKQEETNSK